MLPSSQVCPEWSIRAKSCLRLTPWAPGSLEALSNVTSDAGIPGNHAGSVDSWSQTSLSSTTNASRSTVVLKTCGRRHKYYTHLLLTKQIYLETKLENCTQDYKFNLITNIDNLNSLKDCFILSGGSKSSNQLSCGLHHSLQNLHEDLVNLIIYNITPLSCEAVKAGTKECISEMDVFFNTCIGNHTSCVIEKANTSLILQRFIEGTLTRFQVPHSSSTLVENPETSSDCERKQQKMIAEGKWSGPISNHATTVKTGLNHARPSEIYKLNAVVQQMSLKQPQLYTTVLHIKFSYSHIATATPFIKGYLPLYQTGHLIICFMSPPTFLPTL